MRWVCGRSLASKEQERKLEQEAEAVPVAKDVFHGLLLQRLLLCHKQTEMQEELLGQIAEAVTEY